MLQKFYKILWEDAYNHKNDSNIKSLLEKNPAAKIVDIGCGDGKKTVSFSKVVQSNDIIGIDAQAGRLEAAKKRGLKTLKGNLEKKWPIKNNFCDLVISNQVIEHMINFDHFISETKRILKPGGYAVISTENLASWHNIFSLILGFQDFSHHLISKVHVGNPLSQHFGEKTVSWSAKDNSGIDDSAFPHTKIPTYKSLIKIFEAYGFKFEKGLGSGYYPFFGLIGNIFSKIDPFHSHFITIKVRKEK